jgi:hypothetical protein
MAHRPAVSARGLSRRPDGVLSRWPPTSASVLTCHSHRTGDPECGAPHWGLRGMLGSQTSRRMHVCGAAGINPYLSHNGCERSPPECLWHHRQLLITHNHLLPAASYQTLGDTFRPSMRDGGPLDVCDSTCVERRCIDAHNDRSSYQPRRLASSCCATVEPSQAVYVRLADDCHIRGLALEFLRGNQNRLQTPPTSCECSLRVSFSPSGFPLAIHG